MNLAIRDIRRHKTRFLLTCIGLGLLLTVVMAMSGIYRGLIGDATKVVEGDPCPNLGGPEGHARAVRGKFEIAGRH